MRLTIVGILLGFSMLSACEPDGLADQIARKEAKEVIRPVLADKFPGVPLEPATDCVIDNASASEIFQLASASITGPGPEEVTLIVDIATRPETVTCLVDEAGTMILSDLFR